MKWVWKIDGEGNASDRRMPGCDRAAFDAWDAAMRRRLGWRAGLAFWKKTNTAARVVVSRHWPHRLCWDWALWFEPYRGAKRDGERRIGVIFCYHTLTLDLAVFALSFRWQNYGEMVASQYKADAPVVRYPWGGIGGGEKGRLPRSLTKILLDANDD